MGYESKRWFMLIANIFINICVGAGYAWSVFQGPLIAEFSWTPVEVSLAFTLIMTISVLPMALAGKLQEYMQPKTILLLGGLIFGGSIFLTGYIKTLWGLYLAFGLGAGLGQGIVYSTGVSNMVKFFPDRRGLCSGLLAAGFGSGAIIIAPTAAALINHYDVLTTFKILGLAFIVVICGLSRLIATTPLGFKPKGWVCEAKNIITGVNKDWRQMLKDPLFYLIAGMFVTGIISGMMVIGHASPIFQEKAGMTPQAAAFFVGLLSLFNTIGRILWGTISDRIGRYHTSIILYLIVGLSTLGVGTVNNNIFFITLIMGVGLCFGGFMSMIASLTADAFGTKHLPINFGIMFLAFGVAAFIGPRLAALVKEANNGDYSIAFLIAAVISLLGIILALKAMSKAKSKFMGAKS